MILNLGSLAFNASIENGGGTPAWGTELGQGEGYKFSFENMDEFFIGLVYSSIKNINDIFCPLGKGGKQQQDYEFVIASLFDKIYVNNKLVKDARFILLVIKKINGDYHVGRRSLKYNPKITYKGEEINEDCFKKMASTLGLNENSAWFVNEINIKNQDELHFDAYILGENVQKYQSAEEKKQAFLSKLPKGKIGKSDFFSPLIGPLQQIYYGAPGTGKSHKIKEQEKGFAKVFRTTFHPDSDYSTFVGCYKPTMEEGAVYGPQGPLKDGKGAEIKENKIVYSFVAQAFTKAYIEAWKKYNVEGEKPVLLVIEEINRGNCAQIFGDLFQLLDHNDYGFSDYPIDADHDLQKYIAENGELAVSEVYDCNGKDISEEINSGEKLMLPPNLYIWATMNTSDQSLFPIDSAFKRRWDWKYIPINTKAKNDWKIKIDGKDYSWSSFLEKINAEIQAKTSSEDKQLGFFFCKADKADADGNNGEISAEKFVGKVLFYIYNDVFKDYGLDCSFFKEKGDDNDNKKITFQSLFKMNGDVNEARVALLLENLGVEGNDVNSPTDDPLPEVDENGNNTSSATKDFSKYAINGSEPYSKGSVVLEAVKIYIANNPQKNAEDIKNDWLSLGVNVPNFIETKSMFDDRKQKSRDSRINEKAKIATLSNGEILYVSNQYNPERIADLISKVNATNWNITISKV